MEKDNARMKFVDWLKAEWVIAVFENKDLGHPNVGHRIALPYGAAEAEHFQVGRDKAPDSKAYGLGWRYILVATCRDVGSAMAAMQFEGVANAQG